MRSGYWERYEQMHNMCKVRGRLRPSPKPYVVLYVNAAYGHKKVYAWLTETVPISRKSLGIKREGSQLCAR
jgi:hypothetical protein